MTDYTHFIRVKEHFQPCSSQQVRITLHLSAQEITRSKYIKTSYLQTFFLFRFLSFGLEYKKQSGKFYAVKMAPVDWGSGVCASAYESYMKLFLREARPCCCGPNYSTRSNMQIYRWKKQQGAGGKRRGTGQEEGTTKEQDLPSFKPLLNSSLLP